MYTDLKCVSEMIVTLLNRFYIMIHRFNGVRQCFKVTKLITMQYKRSAVISEQGYRGEKIIACFHPIGWWKPGSAGIHQSGRKQNKKDDYIEVWVM